MTEIVVRKCTLRLVRQGGWSWGPDPRGLLEDVLGVVPELIAEKLEELIPAVGVEDIYEPIRIRLPVRRSYLKQGADGEGASKVREALARSLERAVLEAVDQRQATSKIEGREQPRKGAPTKPAETDSTDVAQVLLSRLIEWRERGVLDWALRTCSEEELIRWRQLLLEMMPSGSRAAGTTPGLGFRPSSTKEFEQGGGQTESLLKWIDAAVQALAAGQSEADFFDLAETASYPAAVDESAPISRRAVQAAAIDTEPTQALEALGPAPHASEYQRQPSTTSSSELQPAVELDVCVESTLPWLMLSPLSRLGLLDAAMVAMELADCRQDASYWATALAYKVLDPPARGWNRTRAAEISAATFAGLTEPISQPGLAQFARQIDGFTGVFDAAVSDSTLSGRNADTALLVWSTPDCATGKLLLLDPEGLFPAAWVREDEELLSVLEIAEKPLLVLPREVTDPGLFRALTQAGHQFLTDAPPGRHDEWHRVRGAGEGRWWRNRPGSISVACRRQIREFEETATLTRALVDQVLISRPALPLDAGSRLERSVSLAAANALGVIAWELWRDRESVDPSLTVERFADLDGVVRFRRDHVEIRLPLGKRYRDLYEHGLLHVVAGVPWLGGRRVEFGGG